MARDEGEEDVDDLDRVLGYRGAADERRGVTELAPDLLVVPFWRPDFCAAVVRAAQLVGFAPDPDDPVPGHEVSLAAISPRLYQAVQDDLGLGSGRSSVRRGRSSSTTVSATRS